MEAYVPVGLAVATGVLFGLLYIQGVSGMFAMAVYFENSHDFGSLFVCPTYTPTLMQYRSTCLCKGQIS